MAQTHAGTHEHKHPYHLVDPSPWPIIGTIAATVLAVGGIMYMHDVAPGGWVLAAGVFLLLFTMVGWWRDVIRESSYQHAHTPVVKLGLRYGMALFIASEVMFFAAFFWAFFNFALFPPEAIGEVWPPENIHVFNPWDLPLLMTLVLLTSGCTVTWAHHAILENNRQQALQALALTVLLGIAFLCIQVYEYSLGYFGFRDGVYPSVFYMATGFHGFHVFVGTIFLIVCFFRAYAGQFTPHSHFGFEAAAWYWHFVDVVWLFLFFCVYVWGNWGAWY